MATELPKDRKNYIIIEPTKVTVALFTIMIGLGGWMGKMMYEKLTSIETDVKTLLIAQSIDKTNIDNIKDQMKKNDEQGSPGKGKKLVSLIPFEFILPKDTVVVSDNKNTSI